MARENWRERLLGSTRGRVVVLLRRSAQTVNDLAEKLALTDNAVRLQLSALERDGLVEQRGTRSEWTGKPAFVYQATLEAESLFPKPYDRILDELLNILEELHTPEEVDRLMYEVGSRLGREVAAVSGDLRARLTRAAAVLNGLGGLAEVEQDDAGLRLQGYSCPLGALTGAHPVTCRVAEALVTVVAGTPMIERCDRGERPRCAFRVAP